jgi:hypothetical protein
MTYILITLIGASFIFEYQLFKKINKVKKENQKLQTALSALGRDTTNFQAGISRDSHSQKKELEITVKRMDKKVDVMRRDIINSLPTQIRKVIGHIEFSTRA